MNDMGRAENTKDRKMILNRILAVWEQCPHLRLGQLIENARQSDLFFVEDRALAETLENFLKAYYKTEL